MTTRGHHGLMLAGGGAGDPLATSIMSKLVEWWPHDETSGATFAGVHGGHDGTYTNSPALSANGVTFNGSTQYGTVADDAAFELDDFTFGGRIRFSGTPTARYILNKWFGYGLATSWDGSGYRGLFIDSDMSNLQSSSGSGMGDNVERLVMLTRVGTSMIVTISGLSDGLSTVTNKPVYKDTTPLTFGRNGYGGDFFPGRIAHSFYSAPLSSTERGYIINSGTFRSYADIVAAA